MTVGDLCAECRNWFVRNVIRGRFEISEGVLRAADGEVDLTAGTYVRLIGSRFNDGVWPLPASGLHDEVFDGAVWLMAPPPDFVALCGEIDRWQARAAGALEEALASPYRSESFGGYEYVRASGTASANWRDEALGFFPRLRQYRKM